MTAIETAGLALCADKYKITRLVKKTLKRLKPTSAKDVFPALICVTFASFPELEVQVCKIIQKDTDKVVGSADFLKLDEASLLFILKQDTLNIEELELWEHVVCWAEHQGEINPGRTVRDCLAKILAYVRFLTFTLEEIVENVLPTEALTSDEFVDLVRAVTKKQPLKSSLLCNVREKRVLYQVEEEVIVRSTLDNLGNKIKDLGQKKINNSFYVTPKKLKATNFETKDEVSVESESSTFNKLCNFRASDHYMVETGKSDHSIFSVQPRQSIEIDYFICKSRSHQVRSQIFFRDTLYNYRCEITITNFEKRVKCKQLVAGTAAFGGELVLPVRLKSGKPIVMNPNETWTFRLSWIRCLPHPTYSLLDSVPGGADVTAMPLEKKNMTVTYETPFHVLQIAYKEL